MQQATMDSTVAHPRILINSSPSGCPHVLASAIEGLGYSSYATSKNYQVGTPTSFNFRQSKNASNYYRNLKAQEHQTQKTHPPDRSIDQPMIGLGGLSPYAVEASIVRFWLEQVSEQQYILGHISYSVALSQILTELSYVHLLVIADPRAIAASLLQFALDQNRPVKHFLQDDLLALPPEKRLQFLLEGGEAPEAGVILHDFAKVYRSILAWREDPSCIVVHLEDLAIAPNQSLSVRQRSAIEQLTLALEHSLKTDSSQAESEISPYQTTTKTRLYQQLTTTSLPDAFKPHAWRNSLTNRELEQLLDYCAPLCSEAGYNTST